MPTRRPPLLRLARTLLQGAGLLALGVWGCGGGDGNTGAGGVLVVAQVQIDAGNRVVLVGGTRQLAASPRTSTGIVVPGKSPSWSSSNSLVATVSGSGVVSGHAVGPATITATVDGVAGRVDLDIRPVPVATVEVTLGAATLLAGVTTTAQATARDSVAGVLLGRAPQWNSTNEAVATVSQAGVVTAVSSGSAMITATIEGKVGSAPVTVTARTASKLGFITQPTQAVAGAAIAPPIQVAFQDATGGTANETPGTITLGWSSNPTGATLGGTLTVAAVNGVATFSDVRVDRAGQPYSLQAIATGFPVATSATFAIGSAAASGLGIAVAPTGSASSGAPLGVQPVIEVRDALGNRVPQGGVQVTASVATGPGVLAGTTTATTAADGRATFTNLAITGAVGTYTLRFTAPGLAEVISGPIGLGAGGATQLTFTTAPPASQPNGEPLPAPVRVQLRDGTGNPVAQAGTSVTATLQGGAALLSGTPTAVTGANGEAVFPGLVITGVVGNYTLTFSATGVTPAVSNPIALVAGPERAIGFVTPPAGTSVNGAVLPTPPVLQLRDVSGNPVSKAGVAFQVDLQAVLVGALGGTASRITDGQGRATFSDLVITGQAGNYILAFGSGTLSEAVSNPIQLLAGPAAGIGFKVAPPAGAQNGVPLVPQPVIQVVDQSGNAVAQGGLTVTVALASGPGLLGGTTTAVTDGSGAAAFSGLLLNGSAGSYTLRFSATGFPNLVSAAITVGAGAPTQVTFTTAPPASAQNAVAVAPAVVVQLRDGVGNPVAQSGVSITATRASGPGVLGGTVIVVTDAGGSASFANLVITGTVGNYTLQFAASGLTPAVSDPIALTAGAATQLAFTTAPPSTAVNGAILAPSPVVQLRDQSGNPVTTSGTSITADLSAGAGGSLSGTLTRTTASGSATFSDLRITGTVGSYTLRFSATGLTPVSAPPPHLTLTVGPATQLGLAVAPSPSATSGVALATQPQVQVRDQSGNPVPQGGLLVTAVISAGASLSNATATTGSNGLATFSGLTVSGPAGPYTMTFQASGFPNLAGGTITVGAGAATQMVFITAPPAGATNGAPLSPQPVVELRDGSGNPVPVAGTSVTAAVLSGPGVLMGTVTVQTAADGRAAFTDLNLQGNPGTYVLRFASGALPNLDSGDITLVVGPATKLVFQAAPPATATNGQPFGTSTEVALADLTGNLVPTNGVSIVAAVASGPGATLGGTTTRQTSGGVATFDDLSLTGTAGSYTLDFTSGSLTKATSGSVTLNPGPATQLGFATNPPTTGSSGAALSPATVVQLRDASGNSVPQSGVTVSAALLPPVPGGATLTGNSAVTDGTGRATFAGLTITGPDDTYTIAFTSGSLTGVTSAPIAIAPGAAAKLSFITTPSATAQVGKPLAQQPVVQLLDASNNTVAQAGIAITVAVNSGAGTLGGGALTVNTDASGQASFAGLAFTGVIGIRTLAFSGSGLTTLVSGDIDVTAGDPAGLAMVDQPPATASSGAGFSSDPSVRLVDVSGNAVATSGTSVSVALLVPGGATLGGTTTQATDGSGVATFPGLSITGPGGSYQLQFTSTGLGSVTSSAIALSGATGLAITTQPSASVQNDVAFPQQPAIQLVDGVTPVALAGVQVTATIKTGQGTLMGTATATSDAGGLATFTDLKIRGQVGDRTIEFTAAGLTPVTSGTITVSAGAATALAMVTQPPSTVLSGGTLNPSPAVRIVDISGNAVASPGIDVTVGVSPAATLGGTTTVATDAGGVATFAGLSITGATNDYQLDFTAPSLTGVSSGSITVTSASGVSITTQPSATVRNDVVLAQQPTVQLVDAADAPVAIGGITVSAEIATGAGTLLGTLEATTNGSGVATFTDLRIQGSVGVRTLRFVATGLTPDTSTGISVTAGTATALAMVTEPGATAVDEQALPVSPVVRLVDISGNPVDSTGVVIGVAVTPAGPVLGGTTSVATVAGGSATFTGLSLNGAAGDYRLEFSGTGLTSVQSSQVTLLVPAGIAVSTQPSPTGTRNVVLATQPQVTVTDAGAAGIQGVLVTATLVTISGPTGTLGGTASRTTGAGGIAVWSDLMIQKPNSGPGQYLLRFTTSNGLTVDSDPIAVP